MTGTCVTIGGKFDEMILLHDWKYTIFREINENMKIRYLICHFRFFHRSLNEKENYNMNGILFGASVYQSLLNCSIIRRINWVAKIIENNVPISYALTIKCEQLNKSLANNNGIPRFIYWKCSVIMNFRYKRIFIHIISLIFALGIVLKWFKC